MYALTLVAVSSLPNVSDDVSRLFQYNTDVNLVLTLALWLPCLHYQTLSHEYKAVQVLADCCIAPGSAFDRI